jgi:hypothetical protein
MCEGHGEKRSENGKNKPDVALMHSAIFIENRTN